MVFIFLTVPLSWVSPSKTKLLMEFSSIYKRLKIKGKSHAKATGGKKNNNQKPTFQELHPLHQTTESVT